MFVTGRSAESDTSDQGTQAARASGAEKSNGSKAQILTPFLGAAHGAQAEWRWWVARDVEKTINRIRRTPAGGATDAWLRDVAADTLRKTGPDGKSGAFGQLRGHLFEEWDIRDYNLRRGGKYRLVQRVHPRNPGYDASRFHINGRFAGAVQHKCGPASIAKAIEKIEKSKPGSACKATIRVPKDRADACWKAAAGRIRIQASRLSDKTITRRAKTGLRDIASHGEAATSLGLQAARGAAKSAAGATVVSGLGDLGALLRHDLNAHQFVARRCVDAAEAGVAAAATATTTCAVTAAITAGATSLASGAVAGTLAATVAGTVAASTVVVPAGAAVAVGYGISRVAKPARRYVTERLRSRADEETSPNAVPERGRAA